MPASTDYNVAVTRNQYVIRACKLVGLIADGGNAVIQPDMLADGIALLADLNAAWANEGINLNVNRESTFAMPTANVVLGTDGTTNYTCIKGHVADATTRPTTGALWTDYWKATGTGGVAWASGATYVAPHEFSLPAGLLYVKDAFVRDTSGYDYDLMMVDESDYLGITDKFTSGKPDRLWIQERPWNARIARMYPAFPDQSTYVLHVNGVYYMGDFTNATTELDAPASARLALTFDLASLIADLYQRPQQAAQFAGRAVALKRNFFRSHQESESRPRQVAPRFSSSRYPNRYRS